MKRLSKYIKRKKNTRFGGQRRRKTTKRRYSGRKRTGKRRIIRRRSGRQWPQLPSDMIPQLPSTYNLYPKTTAGHKQFLLDQVTAAAATGDENAIRSAINSFYPMEIQYTSQEEIKNAIEKGKTQRF